MSLGTKINAAIMATLTVSAVMAAEPKSEIVVYQPNETHCVYFV